MRLWICGVVLAGCTATPVPEKFLADWESLGKHEASPEWFRDAKLGIYFHWGVYAVPAFGSEWYPRFMHMEGHPVYEHHLETYGHPSAFGYHDFVPMFGAEFFDAEAWADLFQKAGARFAGPVAEHHDGFSMWDSDITPWNSMDMGPGKDITGEMAAALEKRGIRLITTFHHAKQLQRYDSVRSEGHEPYQWSHYPYDEEMPTSSDDKKLQYLYGNMPADKWLDEVWLGKLKEVIDNYQPDIIWFDYVLDKIPEEQRRQFCSYYLNAAEQWDKEVVIVRKQDDLPLEFTVDDLEKSRKNRLDPDPWMTDETISMGSWCYTKDLKIKAAADLLHVLIDIVSKNGVLLLNVSPRADGIIPDDQQQVLLKMGAWLDAYGEAIYGSRPWYTYGEGPTKEPEGHFKHHEEFLKLKYSWEDVRYTTSSETIYASLLGWPGAGKEITLEAFAGHQLPEELEIKQVTMLGCKEEIMWHQVPDGLALVSPSMAPDSMAVVFKIETR